MSALGWYICFPLSANTSVYAALLEFCGMFLNQTASVQSAVQEDRFHEAGVHKTGVVNIGEVSVLFVSVAVALFFVASLVLSTLLIDNNVLTSVVDKSSISEPPQDNLPTKVLLPIDKGVGDQVQDCCTRIE